MKEKEESRITEEIFNIPIICPVCGRRFYDVRKCEKHMSKEHTIEEIRKAIENIKKNRVIPYTPFSLSPYQV